MSGEDKTPAEHGGSSLTEGANVALGDAEVASKLNAALRAPVPHLVVTGGGAGGVLSASGAALRTASFAEHIEGVAGKAAVVGKLATIAETGKTSDWVEGTTALVGNVLGPAAAGLAGGGAIASNVVRVGEETSPYKRAEKGFKAVGEVGAGGIGGILAGPRGFDTGVSMADAITDTTIAATVPITDRAAQAWYDHQAWANAHTGPVQQNTARHQDEPGHIAVRDALGSQGDFSAPDDAGRRFDSVTGRYETAPRLTTYADTDPDADPAPAAASAAASVGAAPAWYDAEDAPSPASPEASDVADASAPPATTEDAEPDGHGSDLDDASASQVPDTADASPATGFSAEDEAAPDAAAPGDISGFAGFSAEDDGTSDLAPLDPVDAPSAWSAEEAPSDPEPSESEPIDQGADSPNEDDGSAADDVSGSAEPFDDPPGAAPDDEGYDSGDGGSDTGGGDDDD